MPGQAPPLPNERDQLLAFLNQQRDGLRNAAYGLTDEQARATPTASTLSIGGIIKHVADMERSWMNTVLQRAADESQGDYMANFQLADDETLADALAAFETAAAETDAVMMKTDLDEPVPVPKGVPWHPQDLDAWTVRWVLLHLIEEIARHAGHADIVRESIDGATMFPLMAAVEGWPATEWLQPWQPPSD
jgi:uncharacterized damage-inducible protein DinB